MKKKKAEAKKSLQFPKNYRFITERIKKSKKELKILGLGFAFGTALILIILVSLDLVSSFKQKTEAENKRSTLMSQVNYWKDVIDKQKGYRDGYFMLSVLEYQLDDLNKSEDYLRKVLSIDPNFKPGLDFQKILSAGRRKEM